jgi:hypothetical protein
MSKHVEKKFSFVTSFQVGDHVEFSYVLNGVAKRKRGKVVAEVPSQENPIAVFEALPNKSVSKLICGQKIDPYERRTLLIEVSGKEGMKSMVYWSVLGKMERI